MTKRSDVEQGGRRAVETGSEARRRLLKGIPAQERRRPLAGISTVVLEGGAGPPLVLLHGPAGNATHWMRVLPDLVRSHHVVAPDLPGQGASEVTDGRLDADRVIAWLGELIERTCSSPAILVGFTLGGAIAARFAAVRGDRISRLVLVDTLGLVEFAPIPDFGLALREFLARPTERTHDALWRHCAADLDQLHRGMGEAVWEIFRTYNVDRITTPSVQTALGTLMEQLGIPAIAPATLARIRVPTTLIWGRRDAATPLAVAEAASARYGWALHVIEECGDEPPLEQPEAFLHALRSAIGEELDGRNMGLAR